MPNKPGEWGSFGQCVDLGPRLKDLAGDPQYLGVTHPG